MGEANVPELLTAGGTYTMAWRVSFCNHHLGRAIWVFYRPSLREGTCKTWKRLYRPSVMWWSRQSHRHELPCYEWVPRMFP